MTDLSKVKFRLALSLYKYELARKKYELCPSNTGFFKPFKTYSDVQQQIKTTLIPPLFGLVSTMEDICHLIRGILMMAVSIPCVSPELFIEGLVDGVAAIESVVVTPLVVCAVTLASLVSYMVTRRLGTIFCYDDRDLKKMLPRKHADSFSYDSGEFINQLFSFLPENPYENTEITSGKRRLILSLYKFESARKKYELCPSKIGFFQPFKTSSDVQQQVKTTLIPPLFGLVSTMESICHLIGSILMMGVSIPCISPKLFAEGVVDSVAAIESAVVTPLVVCAVTLASLVSMVTRTLATMFSYDGGTFNNRLASFLPENPYENIRVFTLK